MSEAQKLALKSSVCPDCGCGKFLRGPQGGECVNIKCANRKCGSEFNVGPITAAYQRI